MPYIRKTSLSFGHYLITLPKLTRTNWQVMREMEDHGFWNKRLDDIGVYLVPISFSCYGWFLPDGNIYIPAVTLANLGDLLTGHHTRLTDVLRHEWAHALADCRPRLVDNRRFRNAFGAAYGCQNTIAYYDPDSHLTPYAATLPCEDFAETFHFYLRHKGRLPQRYHNKPDIVCKWKFIEWIAGQPHRG